MANPPGVTGDQRDLITVAAKHYVTQQSGISDVEINVEKVDGDYGRVSIKPRDAAKADPGWVFLKRENGTWRGLAIGTDFSSDDLKQRGIPISLQPTAAANLELILDASGSMATKIGGRNKMEIAKQALNALLSALPTDTDVAVRAYGHRKNGDCGDIQLIANFGETRASISSKVNLLKPVGKTPLAASIELAAKDFAGREGQDNTIILITDGEETCGGNPCEVAKVAHQGGVKVKINVIGFKIEPKERAQLECIAEAGGGKYVSANDARELAEATKQVAPVEPTSPAPTTPPPATPAPTPDRNILAAANGGQLLVAPNDTWSGTIDGKEEQVQLAVQNEAVYAFKDESPATFDTFTTLVKETADDNLKEFELLVGDESPTGSFRSIGKFTVANAKLLKSPYQQFKFEPVTAKYLKIKVISNYGSVYPSGMTAARVYEFKLLGKLEPAAANTSSPAASPISKTADNNILAAANGGQLLVAPNDTWSGTIDGKEEYVQLAVGSEAVYAFKDEKPASFDTFATLVKATASTNLKEFELLVGDESPTGAFRSIGKFTVQNVKLLKSPYQEFKFEPVTAKYLKIKIISNYGDVYPSGVVAALVYEFKVFAKPK